MLTRREKRNAISLRMRDDLTRALKTAERDDV